MHTFDAQSRVFEHFVIIEDFLSHLGQCRNANNIHIWCYQPQFVINADCQYWFGVKQFKILDLLLPNVIFFFLLLLFPRCFKLIVSGIHSSLHLFFKWSIDTFSSHIYLFSYDISFLTILKSAQLFRYFKSHIYIFRDFPWSQPFFSYICYDSDDKKSLEAYII